MGLRTIAGWSLLLVVCASGCHRDIKLMDDLSWMDNTYNPHSHVGSGIGRGTVREYIRGENGKPDEIFMSSKETLEFNGCTLTARITPEPDETEEVQHEWTWTVNLSDIDPQSLKVRGFAKYGSLGCDLLTDEDLRNNPCDHIEMGVTTRNEEPSTTEQSHTVWIKLGGKDHDSRETKKTSHFWIQSDDLEYANRFMKVFKDAVVRCGGRQGAGT